MVKLQVEKLPLASVAVQVTVVMPLLNITPASELPPLPEVAPEIEYVIVTALQLSDVDTILNSAAVVVYVHVFELVERIAFDMQLTAGAVTS